MGEDHQVVCCADLGFDNRGGFLLRLPSSPLRGCCGFGLRFFRPGSLSDGGRYSVLGRLRDRLRRGIRMWVGGWSRGRLADTTPSDDVFAPLAQVHLLGTGTGPLSFRSDRLVCGDALSDVFGRLLCKSRLRLLPLHTDPAVRCVFSSEAKALKLFPRGRVSTHGFGPIQTRCLNGDNQ